MNKSAIGIILIVGWAIIGTLISCAAFCDDKKVNVLDFIILLIAYEVQLFSCFMEG